MAIKKTPVKPPDTRLSARKKPAAVSPAPSRGITWRFGFFDHDGPWPLHGIEPVTHRTLLDKLGHFETSSFSDLSGKQGAKFIAVGALDRAAQRRLEELQRDDCPGLWELHLGGKPRLWGMRDGETMMLIWWDPNHQVCPAHKRHT